jgi:chemotaxis protein CheD
MSSLSPTPTSSSSVLSGGAASSAWLNKLKSAPRKSGEASFFFYDSHFKSPAVKVLPGEYFVDTEDLLIMTTLGSCIAACLWDRTANVGGLNHFMLPEGNGESGRYGLFAMELLINEMLKKGASKSRMEAKVFGGGAVISGMSSLNVGERNTNFVLDFLKTERIPVVSKDVMDIYPRKVCYLPRSGKAMVKRLASANDAILAQDRTAVQKVAPVASSGGSIDLF